MASLSDNENELKLKFIAKAFENHREKIYCVSFFEYGSDAINNVFATVSSNHATVYELNKQNGKISCLQSYLDEAWDESYHCVTFAVDKKTSAPLLIIAGKLGVIKIIDCNTQKMKRSLLGHGYRINYLLNHPLDNNIIISCSDDQSLRIWNIETGHCLAIIAGHDGHRAAVLSCDVHQNGKWLVSCGQDQCIKIWNLMDMNTWIEQSYELPMNHKTKIIQFPVYSRHKIHSDHLDHVCWFNDFILSKSTESVIKIWMPPLDDFEKSIKTIGELRYKDGNGYFMRFGVDFVNNLVAIGDTKGKVYVFELDKYFEINAKELKANDEDKTQHWHTLLKPRYTSKYEPIVLELPECNVPVRSIQFNRLGDVLAVCDSGTIYRYEKVVSKE
eukprot:146764_1